MAVVLVSAGSYLGYQQLADNDCSGQINLTVAAATEIAPAVEQSAQTWMADGANVNGTCVAVNVTGINPAVMAGAIARKHGVTLQGVGDSAAAVTVPDVWLPDSSSWLLRIKQEAAGFQPTDGKSVAQSPVVVGMPIPVAERFGWPDKQLGWKDLLASMKDTKLRTGTVDPARDAAGLAGLLALASVSGSGQAGQKAKVGALRTLAAGSSKLTPDLLDRFPRSDDAPGLAAGISAAPLSEEDVVSFNAARPPVQLAALYLNPQPPPLDYPYAVMPEVDLQKSAAATGLRQALETTTFKNALGAAGLRSSDGTAGAGFAAPVGAPEASAPATAPGADPAGGGEAAAGVAADSISQALGSWFAITIPGRVLSVFDISGSMLKPVPTAGGATRAQVTQGAAAGGLALFDDKWSVGVWLFSTELDGKKPYKEIVPISPLTTGRPELQESVKQIVPKPNGATGLYDTALAAYKKVQEDWQDGVINSVILFTDGKNENKAGIDDDTLVREMKKATDAKKPVRMVIIGIGNEVDRAELEKITSATPAGGVFIAEDPAKISDIFLQAISTRSGAAR